MVETGSRFFRFFEQMSLVRMVKCNVHGCIEFSKCAVNMGAEAIHHGRILSFIASYLMLRVVIAMSNERRSHEPGLLLSA